MTQFRLSPTLAIVVGVGRSRPDDLRRAAILALAFTGACYTGADGSGPHLLAGTGQASADSSGSGDSADTMGDGDSGSPADEMPTPSVRVFRLTHHQWENTVRDLFYLEQPTGLSQEFRSDPKVSGFLFDNNATALEVDQALWSGYQRAAIEVAERVVGDPALVERLAPAGADADARMEGFIDSLGTRAFRRPLTDAERSTLSAAFVEAPANEPAADPFLAGMRVVVEAILQSPAFLYRIETSTAIEGDRIPLDSWEVAQRLSYFLWNSMPDDDLFAAAGADELRDAAAIESHARRMLADGRAREVFEHFHDQLLEAERLASVSPSAAFYPDAPEDLGALALEEQHRFLVDHIGNAGTFSELLTSTKTFVNDELAQIYGLDGTFDSNFTEVTLDPGERAGLLTQTAFLAALATSVNPDPIHRGVFIARRLACLSIAAPPDGVPPLPPVEGKTNRQTVEEHTETPGSACVACHAPVINPFGFAFEHYDSTGAFRTEDNGFAVDSRAVVALGGGTEVADALELAQVLAADESVHACYIRHWLEFAMGRPYVSEDAPLTERLGEASLADEAAIEELLVSLVVSRPFRNRAVEEYQ